MERPAPNSFKLNGPEKKIKGVVFIGDSHVAKMETQARQGCNYELVGIGICAGTHWKLTFGNIIQRSKAEVVVIQMEGNDVSPHPREFLCDKLPIGQKAQHLCALMRLCRQEGKEAYVVKVVSRQNCISQAEETNKLTKGLQEQRKNYFVNHDVDSDNSFASDQVHLTRAGYAKLLSVVDKFIGDMFYFDVLYLCVLIITVFLWGHNSDSA